MLTLYGCEAKLKQIVMLLIQAYARDVHNRIKDERIISSVHARWVQIRTPKSASQELLLHFLFV